MPHTALELLAWIAVAISAGFCEEFIFRGYLQEQCRWLTGGVAAGVVIQALIFGAAHGYQGWALMLTIFVGGLLVEAVVVWRKSLPPTMITHGAADSVGLSSRSWSTSCAGSEALGCAASGTSLTQASPTHRFCWEAKNTS
jgi:membrane protease YdiL (CAAX protease family)